MNQKISLSKLLPHLARYMSLDIFDRLRNLPDETLEVYKPNFIDPDFQASIARDFQAVIRRLESLRHVLVNYAPRYLIELDPVPGKPHGELIEGTFLFADMTGFTSMTELLAGHDQSLGQEILNRITNQFFACILDPLISSGGDLLIFAGDAVLAWFHRQENGYDVVQAVRAGLRMERAAIPFNSFNTEFGTASLTISIGIECGTAYAGVVGTKQRMELLVSGPGTIDAIHAEEKGEPGQVILGKRAKSLAKKHFTFQDDLVIDDLGESLGDYEISLPTARRSSGMTVFSLDIQELLRDMESALERVERLSPFLPEDMLARIVNADRKRELPPELRPVAVQFINIIGLEEIVATYGPKLATEVFQRYFVRIQDIVSQHEGVISQIDAYSKGFALLNSFGTPRVHEGTKRYAISSALKISDALDEINREFSLEPILSQRCGISYGLVFTGEAGTRYRRESVILGTTVNRAARLMSQAVAGQVILDADIWEDAHTAFAGEILDSVSLKGIKEKVVIVNVNRVKTGTRLAPLDRPLVGRESEQELLKKALQSFISEHLFEIYIISGQTGMGKTALMRHFAQNTRDSGLEVIAGCCQPHGRNIPLFCWIDLLSSWFDVDQSTNNETINDRIAQKLHNYKLEAFQDLMFDILCFQSKKNTTIDSPALLTDFLIQLSAQHPIVIILEDIHWIDNESMLILNKLSSHNSCSILLVMTSRQKESGQLSVVSGQKESGQLSVVSGQKESGQLSVVSDQKESGRLSVVSGQKKSGQKENGQKENGQLSVVSDQKATDHLSLTTDHLFTDHLFTDHFFSLTALTDKNIIQIACYKLGVESLEPELAKWITERSGGNPLFAEELCRALLQKEAVVLDKSAGIARWTKQSPSLPLKIHELLLSRVDSLPLPYQDILKIGSVFGASFSFDVLMRLLGKTMPEREIRLAIEHLTYAAFLTPIDKEIWQFNHPLMQETVYETISFSQRRSWHTQIGDILSAYDSLQKGSLSMAAYHYLKGDNPLKAAIFGRQAGDRARRIREYSSAADFYTQVLSISDAPIREKQAAAESLADVLALQEKYSEACEAYSTSTALSIDSKDSTSFNTKAKLAILSGEIEKLQSLVTSQQSAILPWVVGALAWLAANNGEIEQALILANSALANSSEEKIRRPLNALIQTLKADKSPGDYKQWLRQFVESELKGIFSPIDILDMSGDSAKFIQRIIRKNGMTCEEAAQEFDITIEQAKNTLDDLVAKGFIRQSSRKEKRVYLPVFGQKSEKKTPGRLWDSLEL